MPHEIVGEVVGTVLDVGSEIAELGPGALPDRGSRVGCSGWLLAVLLVLCGAIGFYCFWL